MQSKKNSLKTENLIIMGILLLLAVQSILTGCAATQTRTSGVIASREATDIWHSYEVLPNYNYYYVGSDSQPRFIIGIDDKYRLTSKNWKPVELTPEMLNNWINFPRQRVGISLDPYGAFIVDANGNRVGLWYSMRKWRLTGIANVGEDNTISVTRPVQHWGGT